MSCFSLFAALAGPLTRRSSQPPIPLSVQLCVAALMVGTALQLLLLHKHVRLYLAWRHKLAVLNRVARIVAAFVPAVQKDYDVLTRWVAASKHCGQLALGEYALFAPLVQMQASGMFTVPMAAGIFLQPLNAAAALSWVWNAPPAMHKVPGLCELASLICNSTRGGLELLLYMVVDVGAMPGIPAAGYNAFGLPDRCGSATVYAQLLVYANLLFSWAVPLYISGIIELHHKLSFRRSRGMQVVADRSLFLPLPDNVVVSHMSVGLTVPVLLWFAAEQIAPLLKPNGASGVCPT